MTGECGIAIKQNKNAAFTLSEVLIAVVVIGVLAILTIKMIFDISWNVEQKNQFKKTYSTVNNALATIKVNLGVYPNCFYSYQGGPTSWAECQAFFYPEFKKALNISKDCTSNAYANGCIPYYADYVDSSCPGLSQAAIQNGKAYVLADGTIIIPYQILYAPYIVVDINGSRKPNKWGYDVFAMYFKGNNDLLYVGGGGCFNPEPGGKTTEQMLISTFK